MFFRTKQFLFLLLAIATTTSTRAAIIRTPHATSKISPEIINELKDFLDLIPTATVDEIVAKHYITDSNFREVLKYLRSTQFTALEQQAQQIPEVVEILDYLHLLVPNATALHKHHRQQQEQAIYGTVNSRSFDVQLSQEPQLNFVLLNELNEHEVLRTEPEEGESVSTSAPSLTTRLTAQPAQAATPRHLRTFISFVEELLKHLPHDQYVQLINQKRQQNLAFAQFMPRCAALSCVRWSMRR
ncbi:unnamed protein product [Ceratitis capitata]|uniref:(Mediterranean fruit fly) hypothetical protein n=1 Tax=Ceratitis capitata TaxID=7213 RepID=A0A811VHI1_CERCA|nr:unnamed protein product [Ceratitis capitata]